MPVSVSPPIIPHLSTCSAPPSPGTGDWSSHPSVQNFRPQRCSLPNQYSQKKSAVPQHVFSYYF
uniref:Uncharacterized protein n=1 Tax=Anguilla anguilla TaxID=7936 RepID=A0A0E9WWH0_ANGAN